MKPFELAPLPYAYDYLEPVIDAETMKLHHDKHHQAYVNNLKTVSLATSLMCQRTSAKRLSIMVGVIRTTLCSGIS